MTQEMGKTYKSAVAEAEKCAWACRYFAENGARFLADEAIETDADKSYVRYLPLGPVLAVMPWNFPFWQVMRFAAPALDGGQRGAAQACLQRVALRARPRGDRSPRRLPRGRVPDPAHGLQARRRA